MADVTQARLTTPDQNVEASNDWYDLELQPLVVDQIQHLDVAAADGSIVAAGDMPTKPPVQPPARPWYVWPMLIVALVAISSAGVAFQMVSEVPTITLAAWRLQLVTAIMVVPFTMQLTHEARTTLQENWQLLAASGLCLAVHFATWVFAIQTTSLAHALLFISVTPVLLAGGSLLLCKPISAGEIAGTLLACLGISLLARSAQQDKEVSLMGDASAMAGAATFCVYLLVGRRLRAVMGVWVYAMPVTGCAAVVLTLASWPVSGARPWRLGPDGTFGWLTVHYLPYVAYLAVAPGILGHTGFNALLKWLPPLFISLVLTLEPLVGSLLGWLLDTSPAPGPWTYSGGAIILVATAIVTIASNRREALQHEVKPDAEAEPVKPLTPAAARSTGTPALPSAAAPAAILGGRQLHAAAPQLLHTDAGHLQPVRVDLTEQV